MSDRSANNGGNADQEVRERLLRELRGLRAQIMSTNRPICFAHVRDEMPEIAGFLFAGRGLTNVDLRGADLRDIDFRGSDLSGSDFAGARISGARFEMSKLSRDALRAAADWEIYRDGWSAVIEENAQNRPQKVHFRRRPGERFSLAPVLPELVIVARNHVAARSWLTPAELEHLDGDRLAVSVNCLTSWEMVRALKPERLGDTDEDVTTWPVYSAQTYCL